ncbi:MAG: cyclase [Candidatus Rokubacteria bacterium 13_1_40CM_69_27]|nr:MAG: cyclase [Candidatus Rokubacteria bacterium 13_1_40CM_69_27]
MADIVRDTGKKCSNWGKWGAEDELGTLNYITPEMIARATRLVKRGVVFSLAIPLDNTGPQVNQPRRFNPIHRMILTGPDFTTGAVKRPGGVGFADDMVIMALQCATQWDALSHCFLDGKLYNGYDANLVGSEGAKKNGIEKMARHIVARGALLDIARVKGVQWLEPGYAITVDDLEAAMRAQPVTVGTGDALLVRTGQMAMCRARGGWGDYAGGDAPGLSFQTAEWLHAKQVAALATDTWGMEVRPNEIPNTYQPLHQILIPHMGMLVGEIFDLDALAADCAQDRVWEFLFVAPPLPITGAVGTPVNPFAVK